MRAQVRTEGRGAASVRIRWQTAEGRWTAETKDQLLYRQGEEEWRKISGVVEVPQGVGQLVILLGVRDQQATADAAWFDNVQLCPLP